MRKVFLFLILIATLPLSAIDITAEPIALVLNRSADDGTFEIGFSSNEIESILDSVSAVEGDKELNVEPGLYYATDNSVYLYWKILSKKNIKLSLEIADGQEMHPSDNSGPPYLSWSVHWDRKAGTSITGGDISSSTDPNIYKKDVYNHLANGESMTSADSVRLYVKTGDVLGLPLKEYRGTLKATILVVS